MYIQLKIQISTQKTNNIRISKKLINKLLRKNKNNAKEQIKVIKTDEWVLTYLISAIPIVEIDMFLCLKLHFYLYFVNQL